MTRITMTMVSDNKIIEVRECTRFRGYMAYVWIGGALVQVFSGGSRRMVEEDAAHYVQMYRGGLL